MSDVPASRHRMRREAQTPCCRANSRPQQQLRLFDASREFAASRIVTGFSRSCPGAADWAGMGFMLDRALRPAKTVYSRLTGRDANQVQQDHCVPARPTPCRGTHEQ